MAELQDFMISRVRAKIYTIFFDDPNEMFYVRQITRQSGEEINAVRRELSRMEKAGIIKSEQRGNRLYYLLDRKYDFFEDILALVAKSTGIGLSLRKHRAKLGKLKFVMAAGAFLRRKPKEKDAVDLLIVGEVDLDLLDQLVKKEEERLQTEIAYTVLQTSEFSYRKQRRDPFLLGILSQSRYMIIGDEEDLVDGKES